MLRLTFQPDGAGQGLVGGSTITHHQLTHEEVLDQKLGFQPEATWFLTRIMEAWVDFVGALDKVRENDRTLLDNTLVFAHSETEFSSTPSTTCR